MYIIILLNLQFLWSIFHYYNLFLRKEYLNVWITNTQVQIFECSEFACIANIRLPYLTCSKKCLSAIAHAHSTNRSQAHLFVFVNFFLSKTPLQYKTTYIHHGIIYFFHAVFYIIYDILSRWNYYVRCIYICRNVLRFKKNQIRNNAVLSIHLDLKKSIAN